MPARTGDAYITGLREQAAEVYIHGERVADVTAHRVVIDPGLRCIYNERLGTGWLYMWRQPVSRGAMLRAAGIGWPSHQSRR